MHPWIRLAFRTVALVAFAIAPSTALTAATVVAANSGQTVVRYEFVDHNFCSTGESVDVATGGVVNDSGGDGSAGMSGTVEVSQWELAETWYVNPANGAAVVVLSSIDDGGGATTVASSGPGSSGTDAGTIIFYDHFSAAGGDPSADWMVPVEHPEFNSGMNDFCPLMSEALGL